MTVLDVFRDRDDDGILGAVESPVTEAPREDSSDSLIGVVFDGSVVVIALAVLLEI
jgi:hypothetical protein